jgi:hypothetical protein
MANCGETASAFQHRPERALMKFKDDLLVLAAAALGGTAGYLAFFWFTRQGFYGLALPGGLLGLAAGLFLPRFTATPVICGLAALMLGLVAEWQFRPFQADAGFGYFLAHVHQLQPLTWIMIAAGAFLGFWIPWRRRAP